MERTWMCCSPIEVSVFQVTYTGTTIRRGCLRVKMVEAVHLHVNDIVLVYDVHVHVHHVDIVLVYSSVRCSRTCSSCWYCTGTGTGSVSYCIKNQTTFRAGNEAWNCRCSLWIDLNFSGASWGQVCSIEFYETKPAARLERMGVVCLHFSCCNLLRQSILILALKEKFVWKPCAPAPYAYASRLVF